MTVYSLQIDETSKIPSHPLMKKEMNISKSKSSDYRKALAAINQFNTNPDCTNKKGKKGDDSIFGIT
ncbi:hypothetical protein J7K55_01385 [Candidatus Aerophobetes bacterium]|nr:hypothetical protein [Candidatus Aerophobetes bacterium]